MRRIFRLFWPAESTAPSQPQPGTLSPEQRLHLLELLSEVGLDVVAEARGPVPLATFGKRVLERIGPHEQRFGLMPQLQFADGLKAVIRDMAHDRLRVMSPSDFPGVGYVFNATDPDTWPVRTSR